MGLVSAWRSIVERERPWDAPRAEVALEVESAEHAVRSRSARVAIVDWVFMAIPVCSRRSWSGVEA